MADLQQRGLGTFLDQLLGFQQALEASTSAEALAGLVCRAIGRLGGVDGAWLCLGGSRLPAASDLSPACHECAFCRSGVWVSGDCPEAVAGGCRAGQVIGARSLPLRTQRGIYGFIVLPPSGAGDAGGDGAAGAAAAGAGGEVLAAIAAVTALVVENREVYRRLGVANAHLRNLREDIDRRGSAEAGWPAFAPRPGWPAAEGAQLLSRALEQSPASILISAPDGTIEYVNPGFVKASGYQPEEVVGRSPNLLKSGLTAPEEYRALWQIISGGGTWHGEFHNRRKDGSLYWVAASISPVRDETDTTTHYLAVEEDISQLKALQERLAQSEERYRSASEASGDGLFILDAVRDEAGSVEDFRFVEANAAGCTMLGRAKGEIVGHPLSRVLPMARDKGFFDKYRRVFLHRAVLDEQFEIQDVGMPSVWIHHTVVPLVKGIAITSRNITEVKRYEAALKAARVTAEEANAAKSVFLATMSHELRTPLNAILGFSELIRDQAFGPVGARYADYAADIHTSGRHLLDLITAILDISKIEAGKLEIELRPVALTVLLGQCVALMRSRAEAQGLQLVEDFAAGPAELRADERALRQIILNLLSNAVKFTPAGGTITVRTAEAGKDWVELSVSDTGIGIPEDHVERVMRPFEQLDNRYTRGAGGTGLGLALVKALAELHGGSVSLTSKPRHGTTVTVRLPREGLRQAATAPWSFSLGRAGL